MQMQLPIFPRQTRLLSPSWGVFQQEDSVYYFHNGSPVYTHHKDDLNTYRYVTATLIVNKSCQASDLSRVFGVREMRALKKSLIKTKANIIPDYENETLTVELYSLSNPRDNDAAKRICQILNESKTKFPGTNLQLFNKFATA